MVYLAVEPGLDGEIVVQRELGGNFLRRCLGEPEESNSWSVASELHESECIGHRIPDGRTYAALPDANLRERSC